MVSKRENDRTRGGVGLIVGIGDDLNSRLEVIEGAADIAVPQDEIGVHFVGVLNVLLDSLYRVMRVVHDVERRFVCGGAGRRERVDLTVLSLETIVHAVL